MKTLWLMDLPYPRPKREFIPDTNMIKRVGEDSLLLFDLMRKHAHLTDEQIATVVLVLDEICDECWDNYNDCQCWNGD